MNQVINKITEIMVLIYLSHIQKLVKSFQSDPNLLPISLLQFHVYCIPVDEKKSRNKNFW